MMFVTSMYFRTLQQNRFLQLSNLRLVQYVCISFSYILLIFVRCVHSMEDLLCLSLVGNQLLVVAVDHKCYEMQAAVNSTHENIEIWIAIWDWSYSHDHMNH